ncbi:hypothetical protein DVH24_031470 [Malus domestica]|uniref:Uncharacterized protein n=1 Tax=Malus domestica TaxID=3750 RepID=A0A498HIB9_MALDO|nr:hypothetical protein DVH24_031470 [Malus domestica]
MIGLCSHYQCKSNGGGLEPRLFTVLPKNGRKNRGKVFWNREKEMKLVVALIWTMLVEMIVHHV